MHLEFLDERTDGVNGEVPLDVDAQSLWGSKVTYGPVKKYLNGTIDWGTPGNKPRQYPPEYYQSIKEIVEDQDFIFEEHFTETDDGYILGMHRIRSHEFTENGSPVVFF